jgi:adenylate cyclase
VLVGRTGTGNTDMRTTALGELVPGDRDSGADHRDDFRRALPASPGLAQVGPETIFVLAFGILIIWYLPPTDSRLAAFVRAVPKASAVLGLLLNLLLLASCLLLFKYFGLLVDAASIFIILSAVMGCFFSTALLDLGVQNRREAKRRRASAPRSAVQLPR